MEGRVREFCETMHGRLPAYSYIPLSDDAMRIKVMKNRLWNEIRAGEICGSWLKTMPEQQQSVRRAVEMSLVLRRSYFDEQDSLGV
ncbi:MAG: hypothetical protein O2812_02700 [Chloroflexi bacterium]|nr:hypothetical protein [Chloroflexota bacterium]